MTKQQLAQSAGVTVRTLFNWCRPYRKELARMGLKPKDRVLPPRINWCRPYRKELARMGLKPGMRVLPPHIVKWIADKFCIDLET